MNKIKKITIEDIFEQKNINKKKEMFFDSDKLGGRIDFEKINPSKILELLQDASENKLSVHDTNLYIIYLSVPMFRNQKLLEKYEIKDSPYKVIELIFENDIMEITAFADKILAFYGFDENKVKKLKK